MLRKFQLELRFLVARIAVQCRQRRARWRTRCSSCSTTDETHTLINSSTMTQVSSVHADNAFPGQSCGNKVKVPRIELFRPDTLSVVQGLEQYEVRFFLKQQSRPDFFPASSLSQIRKYNLMNSAQRSFPAVYDTCP